MTKNTILFITVVIIFATGIMSASGAPPFGITAPPDLTKEATGITTHVTDAELGTPAVKPPFAIATRTPTGNDFPLGKTDIIWAVDNGAVTATQVVTIEDTTGPTITIVGPSVVTITVGTAYVDAGATAKDIVDGYVTAKIQSVSNVDTNVVGVYSVTYDVSDNAGNKATQKIRTVNVGAVPVVDTTPPTIVPPSSVTIQATGILTKTTLTPPVVTDNVDPSPTVTSNAPAGGFPIGNTIVIWTACDHATSTPNCATVTQSVTIIDTIPPSITPPPDISIRATGTTTYVILGNATVSDLADPNPIVTNYPPAGNNFPVGDNIVMWKACDHTGNCNTATQKVTLLPPGAIMVSHNPPWSINRTAPSTVTFDVTTDQTVNMSWSLDGVRANSSDSYAVTYSSYTNTISTIGEHVVTVTVDNENGIYSKSWNWSAKGGLKLLANLPTVNVGQPTSVTFTVTRKCGIETGDNQTLCVTQPDIPVPGANVYFVGVSNSAVNGITDVNGQTTMLINATIAGIVTATASNPPRYNNDSTNITVGVPVPPSSGGNGGGSNSGGGSSTGGGGGGGGGTAEPYDNILKSPDGRPLYDTQEHDVLTTPVSFRYTIPELGIYNVWVTSTQNGIAALRIEALIGTSKLVGFSAPGIVYKNINAWMDYKRIKNATIQFKVENSWIDNNSLPTDKIKMYLWDNASTKWTELPTTMANKDDMYTYFDAQTTAFSSLAISGVRAVRVDATADLSTPSATVDVINPEPIATGAVGNKGFKSLQIGIVAVVVVLIFYMLRLKKS